MLFYASYFLLCCLPRALADLQVGYPSQPLAQCGGPSQLQWSGAVGETQALVVDDDNQVVIDFGTQPQDTQSVTWYPVNASAASHVYVLVSDSQGHRASSPRLSISNSSDTTCLNTGRINSKLPSFTLFTPSSTSSPSAQTTTQGPSSSSSPSSSSTSSRGTQTPSSSSSTVQQSPSSSPSSALNTKNSPSILITFLFLSLGFTLYNFS